VWILAERQLEPPPFCKTPFMLRFYEQSRINWFFDDITLFKSLNVTPTNDADYMHCLVKERRAGKKSELPRLIVEVGSNIWTSLMEFLYLKGERLDTSSRGYMKLHPALVVQTKTLL
jgi:hypothetical protein